MTETHRLRVNFIFVFGLVLLLGFSHAPAQDKDDLDKRLAESLSLLENNPESEIADKLLEFLAVQNDYVPQEFTSELERILRKTPDTVFAHYQAGLIYAHDITKYDKAIAEFKQGISISLQGGKKYQLKYISYLNYRLASLYLVNGRYREALLVLEDLKKEVDFPYRAQVYNKSGVAYYYQDMLYEALDNFKTALMIDSKYAVAKFNLKSINLKLEHFNAGRVYLKMRRYKEAGGEFEKAILQSPNFVMAHHFLGLGHAYQGKWDKAIEEYEMVIALAPHYKHIHQVHNLLGNAYINFAKGFKENIKNIHLQKGIAEFKTSLSIRPEYTEAIRNLKNIYQTIDLATFMGISHQEAGKQYLNLKLFSKALEEFDKVLIKDPQNKQVRQERVKAIVGWVKTNCCDKRNYEQVITICRRYLTDMKDKKARDDLTLLLGYAYMQKGEAWYDKAIEEFKKIPARAQANYYLGLIYFNQGKFTDSLNELQQAKRADMSNPEYFFMLAKLHYYLKNFKLAKGLFQKALEKIRIQIDLFRSDSFQISYLSQRKGLYEQDLVSVLQSQVGVLPSDKESVGLLINSDNLDAKKLKSVYRYIERYLEKETGFIVVDYKRFENLIAEKLIPEDCADKTCFDEYCWLTDTTRIMLVDLDQWADQTLLSFSMYQPETKFKESVHQQEFQGVELYKSIRQSLEGTAGFFKKQRTRVYCELCPEM